MSEIIDRQALKDAVRRYAGEPIKKKDRKCQAICLDMLGTIDAQPTIDAVPVVHGKWIENTHTNGTTTGGYTIWHDYTCSVCGGIMGRKGDAYCYNCGARMDGKEQS